MVVDWSCGGDVADPEHRHGWPRPNRTVRTPDRKFATKSSARASDLPIARHRSNAHARAERRRNILQRSAAVRTTLLRQVFHTEPQAAGRALGIQALHGPTGQMLQVTASQK